MFVFVLHLIIAQTRFKRDTICSFSDSGRTCDSIITDDGLVFSSACPLMQDYMHLPCAVKCYCSKVPRLECKDVNNTQILTDLKCDESQLNRTSCNLTLKATEPQYDGSGTRCSVSTPHGEKHSCITKSITVHCKIIHINF